MKKYFLLVFIFSCSLIWAQSFTDPEPYGGKKGLKDLVEQEVIYPQEAYKLEVNGDVVLNFVVYSTGQCSEPVIFKSSNNDLLDQEAIRLFKLISWIPGQYGNERVDMDERFMVKFNTYKYDKLCRKRGYKYLNYSVDRISSDPIIFTEEELDTLAFPHTGHKDLDLEKYLGLNVHYPEEAKRYNIEGQTAISFVIEPHGGLTNIHIEKNLGGGCPQEVIRALNQLEWTPAIKNGRAVRSRQFISLRFSLNGIQGFEFLPSNQSGVMF